MGWLITLVGLILLIIFLIMIVIIFFACIRDKLHEKINEFAEKFKK